MEQSAEIVQACSLVAGGIVAEGTDVFVTVGNESEMVVQVHTVSKSPTGEPKDVVDNVAFVTGVPFSEIVIKVYPMVGGAKGSDFQ